MVKANRTTWRGFDRTEGNTAQWAVFARNRACAVFTSTECCDGGGKSANVAALPEALAIVMKAKTVRIRYLTEWKAKTCQGTYLR
jgi:hypothetical protein